MALETRIPKEITDYREKIIFGLSGRQLISIACAVAVVGLTAFILWYLLGINFAIVEYILIVEALPIVAFGFIRHKGMPFEQVVRIQWQYRCGTKRLLNKTSLDLLPSLYLLGQDQNQTIKGAARETISSAYRKARRRKEQRECLAKPAGKKHGPRLARKGAGAPQKGKATQEGTASTV